MIYIEKKDGGISSKMVGSSDDLILELAYGVARWHVLSFNQIETFDPATDKQAMIDTSVEAFSDLMRAALEEMYDRNFHTGKGGPLQ